jgi:hypothetical protein
MMYYNGKIRHSVYKTAENFTNDPFGKLFSNHFVTSIDFCPVHLLCHQLVSKVSSRIQKRELRS